ncbi:PilT/PilU family type 4a pilus ATPase [archaeon]|nr:PilT/PilU family type 4a pilus ATPase [archaeon]
MVTEGSATTLLNYAKEANASDLHIKTNSMPRVRIGGNLEIIDLEQPLTKEDVRDIELGILGEESIARLKDTGSVNSVFSTEDTRYRVNAYRDSRGDSLAIRVVPSSIMSPEMVGLHSDKVWQNIVSLETGLVLVTGETGSGKTSTIASLLEKINTTRSEHILTLEDPIEYIYTDKMSMFSQREVGVNLISYSEGIRESLRQDPDILSIGEIRDAETAEAAITMAATGHLVFSTLHSKTSAEALDRYLSFFKPQDQERIKVGLATSTKYILSQTLFSHRENYGRPMGIEVANIGASSGIQNLIRKGETYQIRGQLQIERNKGSIALDQRLQELYENGAISIGEARAHAVDPSSIS